MGALLALLGMLLLGRVGLRRYRLARSLAGGVLMLAGMTVPGSGTFLPGLLIFLAAGLLPSISDAGMAPAQSACLSRWLFADITRAYDENTAVHRLHR